MDLLSCCEVDSKELLNDVVVVLAGRVWIGLASLSSPCFFCLFFFCRGLDLLRLDGMDLSVGVSVCVCDDGCSSETE